MKAVITVIGRDTVGVVAKVSAVCAELNINIEDVSQSIMQDMFCMIMIGDIDRLSVPFGEWSDALAKLGSDINMAVHVMHEDIFNSMHRI